MRVLTSCHFMRSVDFNIISRLKKCERASKISHSFNILPTYLKVVWCIAIYLRFNLLIEIDLLIDDMISQKTQASIKLVRWKRALRPNNTISSRVQWTITFCKAISLWKVCSFDKLELFELFHNCQGIQRTKIKGYTQRTLSEAHAFNSGPQERFNQQFQHKLPPSVND